jgi:hypothetical protein
VAELLETWLDQSSRLVAVEPQQQHRQSFKALPKGMAVCRMDRANVVRDLFWKDVQYSYGVFFYAPITIQTSFLVASLLAPGNYLQICRFQQDRNI